MEPGSWDEWTREPDPFEKRFAEQLLEAEEGDWVSASMDLDGEEYDEGLVEIRFIRDKPGVREVRCSSSVRFYVVKEHYVFVVSDDLHPIIVTWIGAADDDKVQWTVTTDEL